MKVRMKIFTILALASTMLASACGGGGSENGTPTKLVVIGNSLTYHQALPEIGWFGDWGMASSARDKDFAHLVGAALNLRVTASNLAELELTQDDVSKKIIGLTAAVDEQTIVVIELGDNVPPDGTATFVPRYVALLDAVRPAARLVCVSTWWGVDVQDQAMRTACLAHGGQWVSIGDLFPVRLDDVGAFANRDVDRHPHDWGMARIAERIEAAIRFAS